MSINKNSVKIENVVRIDKDFVHKKKVENVFVSNIVIEKENIFKVTAFFTQAHCVYNDQPSGLSASTYLIELARQANMAICHKFYM
jgi:hypothetical protein